MWRDFLKPSFIFSFVCVFFVSKDNLLDFELIVQILEVQSNLVISNSHISNYRLSRSENLVPVLTRNYDNR